MKNVVNWHFTLVDFAMTKFILKKSLILRKITSSIDTLLKGLNVFVALMCKIKQKPVPNVMKIFQLIFATFAAFTMMKQIKSRYFIATIVGYVVSEVVKLLITVTNAELDGLFQ